MCTQIYKGKLRIINNDPAKSDRGENGRHMQVDNGKEQTYLDKQIQMLHTKHW